MGFLSIDKIQQMGFKYIGNNVLISDKASIYNTKNISIGSYSRIDDFAILSAGDGGIKIGCYVHIACHTSMMGQGEIALDDFSGISSRVAIYSSSDNYDGEWMTNPCVPENLRSTYHKPVHLGKHVVVGTGSTILPGVKLCDGCAVGAMSLVNNSFEALSIILGVPAVFKKRRKNNIYNLEKSINMDLI
ncbi:MAG: acyltransferase [Holophaga sp.]|nr:acyltransferase [Holophaga sp.]